MRRREFLGLLGGTVMSWPLTAQAQPTTPPVVGFLNSASPAGYAAMADAFQQGLKETGYVAGRNVAIEYRWADNRYERLPDLAADLVRRQVTAIFANGPSADAAKAATTTMPIVFMHVAVLINPAWPTSARFKADAGAAASIIGLPVRFLQANNEREIESVFESLSRAHADALLVGRCLPR